MYICIYVYVYVYNCVNNEVLHYNIHELSYIYLLRCMFRCVRINYYDDERHMLLCTVIYVLNVCYYTYMYRNSD